MIQITAEDFRENLYKYITLAGQEEILIQKDEATPAQPPKNWVDELIALVKADPLVDMSGIDEKQCKAERLAEKYESLG